MMPGPELLDRVAAEATRQHRPECVSVMVVAVVGDEPDALFVRAAGMLAREQYPSAQLRYRDGEPVVLYFGRDDFGPGRHEIVLEVL